MVGFFGIPSPECTERISTYSDYLLREEEISKMQQAYVAKFRIGTGVGFAVHTGSLSLVSAAVSGRFPGCCETQTRDDTRWVKKMRYPVVQE